MKIALIFGRKNSKGLKNKNITKINGKPSCFYPINAAISSKIFDKIYVSTDSAFIKTFSQKKKCLIINRPKYLCTDKALLSDAIDHAAKYCKKKYKKIEMFAIFLCNSVCVNKNTVIKMQKKLDTGKYDTVTTISRFDMYSPTRSFQTYQAIEKKQSHLILLHIAAQCLRVIFLIKRMNIHFYGWEKKRGL